MRIVEVPIPTYYGDEICYVNGLRYARDVSWDVLRYRMRRLGFGPVEAAGDDPYWIKNSPDSSHGLLLAWLGERSPTKVLDVGCSDGRFGEKVREQGNQVFGVDLIKHDGVGDRLDGFLEVDLNDGLPEEAGDDYGVVVAADVQEHTIDPGRLLTTWRAG
jgi:2-polyprenyl-3-methyl-5-hydroxy-6-metoxy-1,4-benzoquinol methylase